MQRLLPASALMLIILGCTSPSLPEPDADDGGLFLPDGFRALVVADSTGPTRHIAVNDNGDIYAKLRIPNGDAGNVAIRDSNGDGRADIIKRFGNYPNDGTFATEMRIHNGYLYYSSEQVVYRQELSSDELIPSGQPEIIMMDHHPRQWHNAKSLAFDDDGNMYVTFSAPTNVCENWMTTDGNTTANIMGEYPCPQLADQAGIWRFDADKPKQTQADGQRYATGLRSVVGIAWDDETNSLFGLQHGRDYLYGHAPQFYTPWQNAVMPAEEFVNIREGDDYGWPYTYFDPIAGQRVQAPEYGGDGKQLPDKKYSDPVVGLPAHWAPNDLLFYRGSQFPERYRHGAFVAFHGSTNRAPYPQAGYVVGFIPMDNGKASGPMEIFADGFAGVDTIADMNQARYRPMGLSEGPDGSLYLSESKQGKIWRVMFTGDRDTFGMDQLKSMAVRAQRSYIKTPDPVADNLSLRRISDGRALYTTYCTSCHHDEGQGEDGRYPPLAGSEWVLGDPEQLATIILNGYQGVLTVRGVQYNMAMPAFPFLSDQQVSEIATYIRSEFGNKAGKVSAEVVRTARGN